MSEEVERAAQAICLWDGILGSRECSRDRYRAMARAAIEAVDAFRAEEKRKNCKHYNKFGSGSIGSDGSSVLNWHCKDCGKSGRSETPACLTDAVSKPSVGGE